MANELLDFVMSLVRDTDAAARYAADPDHALAAAGLVGVTSADVNNLLPVVSDSLAMTAPPVGGFGGVEKVDGNVWTGGAATAAFDAFIPLHADSQIVAHHSVINPPDVTSPVPEESSFGNDLPVTDAPVPAPVIDTGHEAMLGWDDAGHVTADPHVPFEHHVIDDHGFSGSEQLD
jgi:hypothetical protein